MFKSFLVQKVDPDAKLPQYETAGASGMDLGVLTEEGKGVMLWPGEIICFGTGLAVQLPVNTEGQVRSRSGLSAKGVVVAGGIGTIDCDYRGEIKVILTNISNEPVLIKHHMRVAQLVICPVIRANPVCVESLDPTLRGGSGFGSTGA